MYDVEDVVEGRSVCVCKRGGASNRQTDTTVINPVISTTMTVARFTSTL